MDRAKCPNMKRKGDVQESGKYQDSTLLSHTRKALEGNLGGRVGRRLEQELGGKQERLRKAERRQMLWLTGDSWSGLYAGPNYPVLPVTHVWWTHVLSVYKL